MPGERKPEEKKPEVKKKREKKGKRVRTGKKHSGVEVKSFYKIEGSSVKWEKRHCPRCGLGTFMAKHRGRETCGRCSYTEFEKKT